jgi:hypothetical protein
MSKSMFDGILGAHLPFLDPLHVYSTPLSARTLKRLALTALQTILSHICVFVLPSASAMGLSIWANASHMHLKDLGALKRSTILSP